MLLHLAIKSMHICSAANFGAQSLAETSLASNLDEYMFGLLPKLGLFWDQFCEPWEYQPTVPVQVAFVTGVARVREPRTLYHGSSRTTRTASAEIRHILRGAGVVATNPNNLRLICRKC